MQSPYHSSGAGWLPPIAVLVHPEREAYKVNCPKVLSQAFLELFVNTVSKILTKKKACPK